MAKINQYSTEEMIINSFLLDKEKKENLLKTLPKKDEKFEKNLRKLLSSENDLLIDLLRKYFKIKDITNII